MTKPPHTASDGAPIMVKDMTEDEFRRAVQLLADKLSVKFVREVTPDYSCLWMVENDPR